MDIVTTRRAVLNTLINRQFDGIVRQFAFAVGKADAQINDMLATPPRKSFGEKVARAMEQKLELAPGFFDDPANADHITETHQVKEPEPAAYKPKEKYSKMGLAMASYYDRLPPLKKAEFEAMIMQLVLDLPAEKRTELAEIFSLFKEAR